MSADSPAKNDPLPEKNESALPVPVPQMEQKLEAALKDLPETKQEQLRETFHEFFMAIIQRGAAPNLDAETARIITESVDKEHEFRYKFRTQQLQESAEESKRDDAFRTLKYTNKIKIVRPVCFVVVAVYTLCLFIGIYLATVGRETLGGSIITGVIASVLSLIAGLGLAPIIKDD